MGQTIPGAHWKGNCLPPPNCLVQVVVSKPWIVHGQGRVGQPRFPYMSPYVDEARGHSLELGEVELQPSHGGWHVLIAGEGCESR